MAVMKTTILKTCTACSPKSNELSNLLLEFEASSYASSCHDSDGYVEQALFSAAARAGVPGCTVSVT